MPNVQVNQETANNQQRADVVALPGGGFVVVWEDFSGRDGDASAPGIKARLLGPDLQPLGPEFLVNTTVADLQNQPAVAARTDGFVVVWNDASKGRTLPGNGIDFDIRAQLYDASGGKVGAEFLVTAEARSEVLPDVVTLADGGFAVAWNAFPQLGVRAYNADGSVRGSAVFDVSPQGAPTIAAYGAGFLVAFASGGGLRVQTFTASGAPTGASVPVVAGTTSLMDVLALGDGGFAVAYGGALGRATVQVFDVAGAAVGSATEIVPGDQRVLSAVLARSDDGFLVIVRVGNADPYELRSRAFDASGAPLGESTSLATGIANAFDPAVATAPSGALVVAFTGGSGDGGAEIFARTIGAPAGGGTSGDDQLLGGPGADTIDGLGGADLIEGFEGDDVLSGGTGDDWLVGGTGDDVLAPGAGVNVVDGSDGVDLVSFAERTLGVWVDLANGSFNDAVAWATFVAMEGVLGGAAADALFGDGAANVLRGGGGGDALDGRAGADTLEGGEGDDFIVGGEGTDTLRGGAGVDTLSGGVGADRFDLGAACGWDVATDFAAAEGDRVGLGGLSFQFLLVYDANGDGTLDSQLSYAGGTFVALGVSTLSLDDWNGLVV